MDCLFTEPRLKKNTITTTAFKRIKLTHQTHTQNHHLDKKQEKLTTNKTRTHQLDLATTTTTKYDSQLTHTRIIKPHIHPSSRPGSPDPVHSPPDNTDNIDASSGVTFHHNVTQDHMTHDKTLDKTQKKIQEKTQDKTQDKTQNKSQDTTQDKTQNKTQNKTQDTTQGKTQDEAQGKTQDEANSNQMKHQEYQSHPIIPRCVDKTVSAYSASNPLHPNPPTRKLTSSAKLVSANRTQYKPWFTDQDPQHWPFKQKLPQVRVIYPTGAHEVFPLLVPKADQDEYRPLDDLLNVITTTLTYYLTPDQSLHFFSEPHPITSLSASTSHTQLNGLSFLKKRPRDRSSPEAGSSSLPKIPLSDGSLDLSSKPLLKEMSKAIRRKNGAEFLGLVGWYNRVMKHLIDGGIIGRQVGWFEGMPQGIWETILGQAYDRQVGPQLELLQGYETWSSNVYGELKPRFISEIIRLVDLRPGMLFLDLGSGIGNIVLQVALEVGCVAVGFEIMDGCATLAENQRAEVVGRAHSLWGVSLGSPLLFQADFTKDPRVGQWLRQADVVLVNNQVFTPDLNESLSLLFLELKDTATIVSLKPFISSSFKLNQRNLDSPLAILTRPAVRPKPPSSIIQVSPGVFKYPHNSVSWTNNPGEFYLSKVDRLNLITFQASLSAS